MSGSDLRFVSEPIPIKYTPSKYSFNDPSFNDSSYLFNLKITNEDNTIKNFTKIEKKKYSNLIELDDNIDYSKIKNFKVNVIKIPSTETNEFILESEFNNETNSFSKRSEDIYIEFTQNNTNMTICNCYFIGVDFNSIFISPPN